MQVLIAVLIGPMLSPAAVGKTHQRTARCRHHRSPGSRCGILIAIAAVPPEVIGVLIGAEVGPLLRSRRKSSQGMARRHRCSCQRRNIIEGIAAGGIPVEVIQMLIGAEIGPVLASAGIAKTGQTAAGASGRWRAALHRLHSSANGHTGGSIRSHSRGLRLVHFDQSAQSIYATLARLARLVGCYSAVPVSRTSRGLIILSRRQAAVLLDGLGHSSQC